MEMEKLKKEVEKELEKLKKLKKTKEIKAAALKNILFVNPFSIAFQKFTPQSKRTIALSTRLQQVSSDDQLLLLPTNVGYVYSL